MNWLVWVPVSSSCPSSEQAACSAGSHWFWVACCQRQSTLSSGQCRGRIRSFQTGPQRLAQILCPPYQSVMVTNVSQSQLGLLKNHLKTWYPLKVAENMYLHHINVIAKCLQSHFKHDFLGQVAGTLKDHVAFHRCHLVVAGKLGGIHNGSNLITLQSITNLLSQSVEKKCYSLIGIKTGLQ